MMFLLSWHSFLFFDRIQTSCRVTREFGSTGFSFSQTKAFAASHGISETLFLLSERNVCEMKPFGKPAGDLGNV